MSTQIILGSPGTGKTTWLLNKVDEYISKGTDPNKIGFISFTKKAVNEAKGRAIEKFKLPTEMFNYYRTIHSLCFYQLSISPVEVMQRKNYIELGNIIGMYMTGIHRQDQEVYEMPEGDQLVFMESLSRLMCKNLKETWNFLNNDIEYIKVDYFQKSIIKYKKSKLLYDFTDMLERYLEQGIAPALDVLFVDEAQDLCALQWRIVEKLMANAKDTFIAGDDDQAIFRWSGADVDYFLDLPKKYPHTILEKSWRLPIMIHRFCNRLVKRIDRRTEKQFSCTNREGKITFVDKIEHIDLSKGDWLILVRNGFKMREIVEYLRMEGLPFETQYYSILEDEALQAAFAWEKLRNGQSIPIDSCRTALNCMSDKHRNKNMGTRYSFPVMNLSVLKSYKLIKDGIENLPWYEALDLISDKDREYFRAVRRRGESLAEKPRIKVSTIHSAKGGEATNVIVYPDQSAKTHKAAWELPDDEVRVFYVAVTRAKENLYIMEPQNKYYFQIN